MRCCVHTLKYSCLRTNTPPRFQSANVACARSRRRAKQKARQRTAELKKHEHDRPLYHRAIRIGGRQHAGGPGQSPTARYGGGSNIFVGRGPQPYAKGKRPNVPTATFTAMHGILYTGWKRWGVLLPIWTIAITGITLRSVFYDSVSDWLGIGIFLLMGWVGALSAYLLWRSHGAYAVRSVLIGGALYSLGALSDGFAWPVVIDKVWGPHETFHLFVLAGLSVHWAFVHQIASGEIKATADQP